MKKGRLFFKQIAQNLQQTHPNAMSSFNQLDQFINRLELNIYKHNVNILGPRIKTQKQYSSASTEICLLSIGLHAAFFLQAFATQTTFQILKATLKISGGHNFMDHQQMTFHFWVAMTNWPPLSYFSRVRGELHPTDRLKISTTVIHKVFVS